MTGLLVKLFFLYLLCLYNVKYKSFLAGTELNFGIANRITGFRFFLHFDRFEKFLKTLKIVYLCVSVCFLVLFGFFLM